MVRNFILSASLRLRPQLVKLTQMATTTIERITGTLLILLRIHEIMFRDFEIHFILSL